METVSRLLKIRAGAQLPRNLCLRPVNIPAGGTILHMPPGPVRQRGGRIHAVENNNLIKSRQ